MNELKATRGEWRKVWQESDCEVWLVKDDDDDPDFGTIAARIVWDECDDPETDPNLCLIAASPELYAALEQAVTSMQDHGWPNSHLAVREARRALAKARGE